MSPYCEARVATDGHLVVVALAGEMDLGAAPQLSALLHEAGSRIGPDRMVAIDLAQVTFCDLAGLRVLLQFNFDRKGRVVLRQPSQAVRRLMGLMDDGLPFTIE